MDTVPSLGAANRAMVNRSLMHEDELLCWWSYTCRSMLTLLPVAGDVSTAPRERVLVIPTVFIFSW